MVPYDPLSFLEKEQKSDEEYKALKASIIFDAVIFAAVLFISLVCKRMGWN